MPPFFTIITSTYNASATLPRLLDSLASQTCRDFNWIVQDGASSDATMQIVEQYHDRLPEILADSGRDKGIYDAWNKALDHWKDNLGEWIIFLGADDTLYECRTLEYCKQKIQMLSEDIIFAAGDIVIVDYDSESRHFVSVDIKKSFSQRYRETPLPHSSLFQRKSLFLTYRFDPKYKITGDYDLILEKWRQPSQASALHICVTKMASGGISSNKNFTKQLKKELGYTIKKHSYTYYIIYRIIESYPLNFIKSMVHNTKIGKNILQAVKSLLYK